MKVYIIPALRLLLVLTIVTGIAYPLAMTLFAYAAGDRQAHGSFVEHNGTIVGSSLIGQKFSRPDYFHSRPSAVDYQPLPSSGTNFGPTSAAMRDSAGIRRKQFAADNFLKEDIVVPKEMLFASGSGLDPHISPEAARLQVERIARARGFDERTRTALIALIDRTIEPPEVGFLGQSRINVLRLNLALDGMQNRE
jgi:potassium-transporting ATPase KdpC subunit